MSFPQGGWAVSEGGLVVVRGAEVLSASGPLRADLLAQGGVIVALGEGIDAPFGATVLDGSGCHVIPALVDLHTHLREPGGEDAETVLSGARAAAVGGFGAVVAMPNTNPPVDSASIARDVAALGKGAAVEVAVAGTITVGRAGERLAPFAELAEAGVRICTDDGSGVQDAALMRRALEYASGVGITLAQHCEDSSLSAQGVMNEGAWSSRLGLAGIPPEAEEHMVARDISLARRTGGRLHLMHLSTATSVALVAEAKRQGLAISAEVTPHHLALTDSELASFDPRFKVNPPLRTELDRKALAEAAATGVLDAIATDHAPHPDQAKEAPLDEAPFGMTGLETAFSVVWGELGHLGIERVCELMSLRPARIAGLSDHGRLLEVGGPANFTVVDLGATWVVDPARGASKSRNSPFTGRTLRGKVRHTVRGGEVVVAEGKALV